MRCHPRHIMESSGRIAESMAWGSFAACSALHATTCLAVTIPRRIASPVFWTIGSKPGVNSMYVCISDAPIPFGAINAA